MDKQHHEMPFHVAYRVMRVNRKTRLETEQLHTIVMGGSITRNQDTTLTEQADLEVEGVLNIGADLIRIWADCTWHDGTKESIPLGTFLPDAPKREVRGVESVQIPLALYGCLRELDDDQLIKPATLAKGSDPMVWIDELITSAGLELAPHEPCVYRLGSPWVYGLGDTKDKSKLDAINELLTLIGWASARTDPYGRIVLQPYVPPTERTAQWVFKEGSGARFEREMTDERDWFDTANQVRVVYSSQDKEIIGLATDTDPQSAYSIPNRGRVISKTYTYSDVPANQTDTQLQAMANAKAKELLVTTQSVIHRLTFTHIYAPIGLGDVIHLEYPSAQISGDYAIRTQKIRLTGGIPIECEARSFTRTTTE